MQEKLTLPDVIQAAKEGKWEVVDAGVPPLADQADILHWVWLEGLDNNDASVQDLAATILEKSVTKIQDDEKERILAIIKGNEDDQKYVRFRLAFALYKRNERVPLVMEKMQEALGDEEVGEIAQRYLQEG